MRYLVFIFAVSVGLVEVTYAQVRDENEPTCAANPAELQLQPETLARLSTVGGLDGLTGTWELTGFLLPKKKLSFNYDSQTFYVQSDTDAPKIASLCADENEPSGLRVSVHSPRCLENKNVTVLSDGENRIRVKGRATRALGQHGGLFKKISPRPLPPGSPKPPGKRPCEIDSN